VYGKHVALVAAGLSRGVRSSNDKINMVMFILRIIVFVFIYNCEDKQQRGMKNPTNDSALCGF
jgi:hypothetical protein